eukprot:6527020-Pyramimonas_sp.AAC.1
MYAWRGSTMSIVCSSATMEARNPRCEGDRRAGSPHEHPARITCSTRSPCRATRPPSGHPHVGPAATHSGLSQGPRGYAPQPRPDPLRWAPQPPPDPLRWAPQP